MNKLQILKQNVKSGTNKALLFSGMAFFAMHLTTAKLHAQETTNFDKIKTTQTFTEPEKATNEKAVELTYEDRQLFKAVQKNDTVAMQKALDRGAKPCTQDPETKFTPIIQAVISNSLEAAGLLLKICPECVNETEGDLTALDYSNMLPDRKEIHNLLLLYGAKTNEQKKQ